VEVAVVEDKNKACETCCNHEKPKNLVERCESWCKDNNKCSNCN